MSIALICSVAFASVPQPLRVTWDTIYAILAFPAKNPQLATPISQGQREATLTPAHESDRRLSGAAPPISRLLPSQAPQRNTAECRGHRSATPHARHEYPAR